MTGSVMSSHEWDDRYRERELVWGAGANIWVERETADLPAGRALDIACGEGRNSVWLASRGWTVVGIDFSAEAIRKAGQLAEAQLTATDNIDFWQRDATALDFAGEFDLVMLVYLQLPEELRRKAVAAAWQALREGGKLLVIAHHSDNLRDGVGGPQDPAVLYSPEDVSADLEVAGAAFELEVAQRALRPVAESDTPAVDTVFRARKSSGR